MMLGPLFPICVTCLESSPGAAISAHSVPAALKAEMDDLVPIRELLSVVVITRAPYGLYSETRSSAFLSCHQNRIAEVATAR